MQAKILNPSLIAFMLSSLNFTIPNTYAQTEPGLWESFNAPEPPYINVLLADPSDARLLYAGTIDGVFRSVDFGLAWIRPQPPLLGNAVLSLIMGREGTLYAGTQRIGVLRSTDRGKSWIRSVGMDNKGEVRSLLEEDGNLVAATGDERLGAEGHGVFFSSDGGMQWHQAKSSNGNLENESVNFLAAVEGILYAGTVGSGLFFSTDAGENWQQADPPMDAIEFSKLIDVNGTPYALSENGDNGVFYATSPPQTWAKIESFPVNDDGDALLYANETLYVGTDVSGIYFSTDGGTTWSHALDDKNVQFIIPSTVRTRLYAGTDSNGVFFSDDSGRTWIQASAPMNDKEVTALTSSIEGRVYAGTPQNGVFRSAEGETWFGSGGDLAILPNTFGVIVREDFIFAYSQQGVLKSIDGGRNWRNVNDNYVVEMLLVETGETPKLFAISRTVGIWRSTDLGESWTFTPDPVISRKRVAELAWLGGRLYAGTDDAGVFYSEDDGENWQQVDPPLDAIEVSTFIEINGTLYALSEDGNQGLFYSTAPPQKWSKVESFPVNDDGDVLLYVDETLYVGTDDNGIYFSKDGGQSWTHADPPVDDKNVNFLITSADGRRLYAGTDVNGVFYSADSGTTWLPANAPMNDKPLEALIAGSDNTLFASTSNFNGVFRSVDGGLNWTPLNHGLEGIEIIWDLVFLPELNRLYAGTLSGVHLQTLDFDPPAAEFLVINGADQRFTNETAVDLAISASGADSMLISEYSDFSQKVQRLEYQQIVQGYPLSNEDGSKKIYIKFKDFSWNESAPTSAHIILDQNQPKFRAHTSPANATAGQSVLIRQQVDEPNLEIMQLFYSRSGDLWSPDRRSVFNRDTATIAEVWIGNKGINYRIVATDSASNSDTMRNGTLDFFSLPVNIAATGLGNSSSLPSGTGGQAYRVVSIPLDVQNAPQVKNVFKDLGKYGRRGEWRFYSYQGNSQWREGENLQMQTGSAHFIIRRDGGSLTNAISGTTAKTTDGVLGNIPGWQLRAGDWTLIGNPYNTKIELNQLSLKSSRSQRLSDPNSPAQIWGYDGRWKNARTEDLELEPWGGLFVRVSRTDTIVFANTEEPYSRTLGKANTAASPLKKLDTGEWWIQITAASGEFSDDTNYLGVKNEAKDELDNLDWYEPPLLPDGVGLSFPHAEWNDPAELTADFRSTIGDGYRWEIAVKGEPTHAVQLSFANIETMPEDLQILLVDVTTKIVRDLRKEPAFAIRIPGAGTKTLAIIAGNDFFINKHTEGMLGVPTTFALHQNYPNPFNPSTTIRYQLPVAGRVTLKIFDIMGREAMTLEENKSREPGYYEMVADMSALGSGVYFYRIAVSGGQKFQATKKMLYVK